MPLAPAIGKDIPGIKNVVRISKSAATIKYGDNVFHETIHFADAAFFSMFTFPLKYGDPDVPQSKNDIVFSEAMAIKYFGDENPVGSQVVLIDKSGELHDFIQALVNEEFIRLLTIAALPASVVGFFAAKALLDSIYAYHISLGATPILLAVLIAFLIAIITVGSQAYKSASANPVESLRYE